MRTRLAVLGAAIVLAACGGGGSGPGEQAPAVHFSSMVSFGDSLSDVGTYRAGTIAALGGGKWTVNGPTARNWTEWIAADIQVAAPCPAQTGYSPNIPGLVGAAVVTAPSCTNYAQGSSRVTGIFAPNSLTLQSPPFNNVNLGLTATPIAVQMASHLAKVGGTYSGTELVTVMAGGNDIFMNANAVGVAATGGNAAVGAGAAAGWTGIDAVLFAGGAPAVQAAATAAVTSMGTAGATLAGLIKAQVLAKGAKYVVVVNLPDVSQTPFAMSQSAQTRGLINQMVTTFNSQLTAGLAGTPVVIVDAYTQGQDQTANPAQYALTNVTTPACSATSPANPLQGSSIGCTAASTIGGDVSGYLYADPVHPTPYGHQLLAQFVAVQMAKAGWL